MSTRPATPPRRRLSRKAIALIAVGLAVFLVLSGLLARFLSVENVEREDLDKLLAAQVRGDVPGMLARLEGCAQRPSCVTATRANAQKLRRTGSPKILSIKSETAYSLAGTSGTTRLAWTVIGRLPVVQCVQVKRTGNALTGIRVALVSLSAPIPNEADC